MKILILTPGIVKKYNDNYYAYDWIAQKGHKLLAITQQENVNKGFGQEPEPEFELVGGIEIYRLFKNLNWLIMLNAYYILL